ncbi:hypothetical protein [Mycobacterium asiaticum]|uniref:hypothetical protein n=1 Tax=Mycobacterium asiaticum TaxID=1790 RepID=UPI0006856EBE|nr:hypothetical protein [Mycobacterium asiaticum]ORA11878.1 hypothetical protein BST16_18635 [Mycobacterium asiaticum DSM 44297]
MTFAMQPDFMQGLVAAQEAACTAITSAFSTVTPAQLSSFSMALGPIAAANMIPAMYESTANNVMSGMLTATNHALLGVATHVSDAAHAAADAVTGV